jgi:predicted permease
MPGRFIRDGVRRLVRLPLHDEQRAHADADDELASFLQARIDDLVAHGWSLEAARAEAVRRLGPPTLDRTRRQLRSSAVRRERRLRIAEGLRELRQDASYALRQLGNAPAFAAVAVLTLALGIGANTTVFTVVDAVLLRALPVPDPEQLIVVGKPTAINGHTTGAPRGDLLSYPVYRDLRRADRLTRGLAATGTAGRLDVRVGDAHELEHPNGRLVSGNYFDVLRVRAEQGRVFEASEDGAAGSSPVAVISDAYWRRRFGGADVVGRRITVDGASIVIAGVAAPGFTGEILERPTDIWLPITMQPVLARHGAPIESRGTSWLLLLGRLAPGVTMEQVRAGLTTMIRASLVANAASPGEAARARQAPTSITSGAQGLSAVRPAFTRALLTLQIGVLVLLAIVCANIANLLIARTAGRGAELSVRLALGAGRSRLVRQLLTESATLAVIGSAIGVLVAWWASRLLVTAAPRGGVIAPSTMDGRTLLFTLGVTALATISFGVVPALRASRADPAQQMRASARTILSSGRRGGLAVGRMLVPIQVALSLVLLTGATLLARSLRNLERLDPGLDRDHLIVASVDVVARGITGERFMALARDLTTRIGGIPGVRAVTYSQNGLFTGSDGSALVAIPGFNGRTSRDSILFYDLVGPGYIAGIGGRMLRGRELDERDAAHTPSVAVVNETMERFYFGGQSAVGKVIYFDAGTPTTIVGVTADVHDQTLVGPPQRRAYVPYAQQITDADQPSLVLEIRTALEPAAVLESVRAAIAAARPDLPIDRIEALSAMMSDSIGQERLVTMMATVFGTLALLLAAVGLYGLMSYAVSRRTGEIGLRAALGADRAAVLRLVLADAFRFVLLGAAAGVPIALGAATALRSQLHDVPVTDPIGVVLPLAALCGAAALAALGPAVRATRVSPAVALTEG